MGAKTGQCLERSVLKLSILREGAGMGSRDQTQRSWRGQSRGNGIIAAEGSLWSEPKGKCSARAREWSKGSGAEVTDQVKK